MSKFDPDHVLTGKHWIGDEFTEVAKGSDYEALFAVTVKLLGAAEGALPWVDTEGVDPADHHGQLEKAINEIKELA